MKPWPLLLLASCVAHVEPAPVAERGKCDPPTFTEPACVIPGCDSRGCVTRCPEPDGTYWDRAGDGSVTHWRWAGATQHQTITICPCALEGLTDGG